MKKHTESSLVLEFHLVLPVLWERGYPNLAAQFSPLRTIGGKGLPGRQSRLRLDGFFFLASLIY